MYGYGDSSWQPAKKTDHVVVEGLGLLAPHPYNISVRAVNSGGLVSDVRTSVAHVDMKTPLFNGIF